MGMGDVVCVCFFQCLCVVFDCVGYGVEGCVFCGCVGVCYCVGSVLGVVVQVGYVLIDIYCVI